MKSNPLYFMEICKHLLKENKLKYVQQVRDDNAMIKEANKQLGMAEWKWEMPYYQMNLFVPLEPGNSGLYESG